MGEKLMRGPKLNNRRKDLMASAAGRGLKAISPFRRSINLGRSSLPALLIVTAIPAAAQTVLPRPEEPFAGTIGETYADSKPAFPKRVVAPDGAPNVFLIMTDDVGFGAASTFGGPIPTPIWTGLPRAGWATTGFIQRRCARRRARRCSRGATIPP